ncbi:App1 family protein [Aureimonas fodinaquatilis]|nr:phosphatase domain-containing protein [Aureimonas fodinaquatilis]
MRSGRLRRLHMGMKRRMGLVDPPMLMPYLGYAGEGGAWLRGRVLEDEGVVSAPHTTSALHNLWLTYKRFSTDQISGARVSWQFGDRSGEVVSDDSGYIEVNTPGVASGASPWLPVRLTLDHAPGYQPSSVMQEGLVRVVSPGARFVIVSDIDDTIIHTGANQLLRHWRVVTANSPESRIAFPGVAEFYHALAAGADGPETNPIFYVSSGPWNLFDLYDRFMALRGIPRGPMLLRNLSNDGLDWILRRHNGHKTRMIEALLNAYPHLPFVLIGDSGQDDAAIYQDIATRFPGRVALVHIHDIRPASPGREVDRQIAALQENGIPVTLSATLVEAARLAESLGFVGSGTADSVSMAVRRRIQGGQSPL